MNDQNKGNLIHNVIKKYDLNFFLYSFNVFEISFIFDIPVDIIIFFFFVLNIHVKKSLNPQMLLLLFLHLYQLKILHFYIVVDIIQHFFHNIFVKMIFFREFKFF